MAISYTRRQRIIFACIAVVVSFFASASSLSIARAPHTRSVATLLAATADVSPSEPSASSNGNNNTSISIQYSYSFQRHVVLDMQENVLASFEFLDEAREAFPSANVMPLQECAFIAGGGLEESTAYSMECNLNVDQSLVESILQEMELKEDVAEIVREKTPRDRFAGFTPERIRFNFQKLQVLLESKLQLSSMVTVVVVNNFPHVLLYDPRHVKERLDFLLAPLPPSVDKGNVNDWPLLASQGFGAGWAIDQVRQALQALPHVVLSMHLEDTFAMKPSLIYFLLSLQVSYEDVDRVRLEIDEWGDVFTFAYLHGDVGLEWTQLNTMLQAFPCLAICSTEPTWQMISDKSTNMRSVLLEDSLHYLQRRLQVGPWTVEAMLKTHPRLSTYGADGKIRPTLDALQANLGLKSIELRKLVLRMPSLIGMSVEESGESGLFQRLRFFEDEVGMTQKELRKAVLRQPSLLQYSVQENLRRKLEYFVSELSIPLDDMPLVITRCPAIWGLSLNESLRPKVNLLMEVCGLSQEEVGRIVTRSPDILSRSLKRSLEPTLDYLRDRLSLSQSELRKVIMSTPRVLIHSIKSSLEPKLQSIENVLGNDGSGENALKVVTENPALLVKSNDVLQKRLNRLLNEDLHEHSKSKEKYVQQALRRGDRSRRKRQVLEMDPSSDEVIREFVSVTVAANELKTSQVNVYNIINTGRVWNGRKLVYGTAPSIEQEAAFTASLPSPISDEDEAQLLKKKPLVFKDLKSALKTSVDVRHHSPAVDTDTVRIAVYVSGRVYPPDSMTEVRGTRRAGGMVLLFPQIQDLHGPELALRLRLAAKRSFGQIMPHVEEGGGGTCYNDGRILIGFPYLRPSRNRCELYACHEAIKVVAQLLKHESSLVSLENETVQVDVYTDSDYSWKLLHNSTRLLHWGATVHESDFVYDGPGPTWRANPDLLHPLCRTYYRLVQQQDSDGTRLTLGKQVNVTFHHAAGSMTRLHKYAMEAAMWMHQRAQTAIKL